MKIRIDITKSISKVKMGTEWFLQQKNQQNSTDSEFRWLYMFELVH